MSGKDFPATVIDHIEACLLAKLERNIEEIDNHPEFRSREKHLPDKMNLLIDLLEQKSLRKYAIFSEVLAHLIILNEELKSEGPWNPKKRTDLIEQLNTKFNNIYGITLDKILYQSKFETQVVFEHCIKVLYNKITNYGYKSYPGLAEVYISLLLNIKDFKVTINPSLILPLSLLLIDDYNIFYKIKGLKSCLAVVKSLKTQNFQGGNFYLVIYGNLVKEVPNKDLEVISLALEGIVHILKLMPKEVKINRLDSVYGIVLEQISLETNLFRKAVLLRYTRIIMLMHGYRCVNRISFKAIVCENLDICTDQNVSEILLYVTLECLEVWVQNCWFIWRYSTDKKILFSLLMVLYTCKDKELATKIHNIVVVLINISSKDDQRIIRQGLDSAPACMNKEYLERLNIIKRQIYLY